MVQLTTRPLMIVARTAGADGSARADRNDGPSMHRLLGWPGATVRAPHIARVGKEQPQGSQTRHSLGRAEYVAGRRRAVHRGGDALPRIGGTEGRVGAGRDGDAGADEAGAGIEPGLLGRRDLSEVVVAAVGNETWVCHHGDAQLCELVRAARWHDAGVLDAVTGRACLLQRGNRDEQLPGSDAVHRNWRPGLVRLRWWRRGRWRWVAWRHPV